MRLLILGGSLFLGRALAEAALARGERVTLFNRGRTNPDLFPEAEHLRGDRTADLSALDGRRWDVVIDTCGYLPEIVRRSAEALAAAVERYLFISTLAAYADVTPLNVDETAPLATAAETYGARKALCEQAAERAMPGRVLVVRPGLIVGPHDTTDVFTYWPVRVADGGEVLAPGHPERRLQLIDVRDLAEWILRMAAGGRTGAYNATGPAEPYSLGDLLAEARQASGSDARFTWVSDEFLLGQQVRPWTEVPLWVPDRPDQAVTRGLLMVNVRKALADGLTFRSLADTMRATLAWARGRPPGYAFRTGPSREREAVLLAKWHGSQS
jgi:2'-hydroxyisoflavone reductase